MSWDIALQKFTRTYASVADIPDDEPEVPLGSRRAVQLAVSAVFPGTDWSDPAWGIWLAAIGSIAFNVGKDPAYSMLLHVRAGAEVVPGIVQLCRQNQWQGLDLSSGDFIDQAEHPQRGLEAWSAYRDQVLGRP